MKIEVLGLKNKGGISNFAILILYALLFILIISLHCLDTEAAMLFKNLET